MTYQDPRYPTNVQGGQVQVVPVYAQSPVVAYPINGPPKAWERMENTGKLCLLLGIINCAMAILMADIAFRIVSVPYGDNSILGTSDVSTVTYQLSYGYFAFMVAYGIVQGILVGYRKSAIEKTVIVMMISLPGVLFIASLGLFMILIPFARGLFLFLPLWGSIIIFQAIAKAQFSMFPVNVRKTIEVAGILVTVLAILFCVSIDIFSGSYKYYGTMVAYAGLVAVGLMILWEAVLVFSVVTHINKGVAASATPVAPTAESTGAQPAEKAKVSGPRPEGDNSVMVGALTFMIVATLFIAVFLPPVTLYFQEPTLELKAAKYLSTGSLSVTVVNTAGKPALGSIQLWIDNGTTSLLFDETSRIEGFGRWDTSRSIKGQLVFQKKDGPNITLKFNGDTIKTIHVRVYYTGDCMIPVAMLFLGTGLAFPWIPRRHRKNRKR